VPTAILVAATLVALVDAALRVWSRARETIATNIFYLAIAWVPFFTLPHASRTLVIVWAAAVGLLSFLDFARMVGLSVHGRFVLPAFGLIAACFPLAATRQGGALAAIPVIALLVFVTTGAVARTPQAFLQKLCLAWLGVLVYGYLYAHAVLFVHAAWPGAVAGTTMLALVILLAKFANIAWLAARRASGRTRIMLIAAPIGGAVGGAILPSLWPALSLATPPLVAVGLVVGLGLSAGCRAHTHIVADVTGEPEQQRKGTMLFGFGLALAVGYWALALWLAPRWA
jgi:predicted CDP-diglyceride synthetase/phosphatidate cytidylyltransferase